MEFWVRNKKSIEANNPLMSNHIIISIYTSRDEPARVKENNFTKGIFRLCFDDIDDNILNEIGSNHNFILFDTQMAKDVIEFVEKHRKSINCIVCHCDAGISRSAGVAAALSKFYSGDDTEFFSKYIPNRKVYRTILEELYNMEDFKTISCA